jgi:hypothetical protein
VTQYFYLPPAISGLLLSPLNLSTWTSRDIQVAAISWVACSLLIWLIASWQVRRHTAKLKPEPALSYPRSIGQQVRFVSDNNYDMVIADYAGWQKGEPWYLVCWMNENGELQQAITREKLLTDRPL